MQNVAVIRLVDNELVWYPPGAGTQPLPLDSEDHRQALHEVLGQHRLTVCFAAPATDVRLLQLPVSAQERKHLAKSLPFSLEEQVADDIDHLHFAAAPLDKTRYSVAVCALEQMQDWAELLADFAGVNHWIAEPLLLPWQSGEWCLVLEGEQAIVRTGACEGFGIERAMLPALLAAASATVPEAIVIYGDDEAADIGLLPEQLQPLAQWRHGNLYSALLLAPALPPLNLLQGGFAARLPLARWWLDWRLVASVFAAAACLQMLATYVDYHNLETENLALRGAVEQSYRKANPKGAMVDAEKQLKNQLDGLRGSAQGAGFVSLMEQVGAVVASQPGTALASLNYSDRGGEMRLNIIASDFGAVERIRSGINAKGLVAVMENSSAQGDKVRARIRVGAS